jgi:Ca-activated chloride channel family protein
MIADFHFLRPLWLAALLVLVPLVLRGLKRTPPDNPWTGLVDPHLLAHLGVGGGKDGTARWPMRMLLAAWIVAILALAGPTWNRVPAVKFRPDTPPLVIVLDLSRSMDALDARPSRLRLAQIELDAFLERLPPRDVGLVVFAADAHVVMPLTEDVKMIRGLLPYLETGLMPVQGSAPATGLEAAWRLIRNAGHEKGDALLVGDGGEGAGEAVSTAAGLRDNGLRVSVLGVGTEEGGHIATPDGNALTGSAGAVVTRLDASVLGAVARAGGGAFAVAGPGDSDLEALLPPTRFVAAGDGSAEATAPEKVVWKDRGPWLILLLLPFAALAFRRGWLGAMVLAIGMGSGPAQALDWESLWRTDDQRALEAFRKGDLRTALSLFRDPFWTGVTLYRLQDFEGAAAVFGRLEGAAARYNEANALVGAERWEEALPVYEEALRLDPRLEAAAVNRDMVAEAVRARAARPAARPPAPPAPSPPAPPTPGDGKVKPYLEEYLAEKGGDRQLKDIPGPTPEHGIKAVMGGGAILAGNEKDVTGETGPGTGQASRRAGAPGEDEESVRRPGSKPGDLAPGGAPPPPDAAVPPPVPTADAPPRESAREGRTALTLGRAVGKSATEGSARRPASGGEPEDQASLQDPEPLAGGTRGEDMDRPVRDEEVADPTDARGRMSPERRQAMEQWLERIPDDPGGLLREKFRREAERARTVAGGSPW